MTTETTINKDFFLELCPLLASAAQKVYDEWDQDENGEDPELGQGGICQDVAAAMAAVLASNGVDCLEVSAAVGEQHVFVVARGEDGVYEIDISPYVYETGGGYTWKKRPGVEIQAADVSVTRLSSDPEEFEALTAFE